jgi:hypothetical protein
VLTPLKEFALGIKVGEVWIERQRIATLAHAEPTRLAVEAIDHRPPPANLCLDFVA